MPIAVFLKENDMKTVLILTGMIMIIIAVEEFHKVLAKIKARTITKCIITDDYSKVVDKVNVKNVTLTENGKATTEKYDVMVADQGLVVAVREKPSTLPVGNIVMKIVFDLKDQDLKKQTDTVTLAVTIPIPEQPKYQKQKLLLSGLIALSGLMIIAGFLM